MVKFKSTADLKNFLKDFTNWNDLQGPYDFGTMVNFLAACLDNLHEFALEVELEELKHMLDSSTKEAFRKLSQHID